MVGTYHVCSGSISPRWDCPEKPPRSKLDEHAEFWQKVGWNWFSVTVTAAIMGYRLAGSSIAHKRRAGEPTVWVLGAVQPSPLAVLPSSLPVKKSVNKKEHVRN